MTRRKWIALAGQAALAQSRRTPIADIIRSFEAQGDHRTGTEPDLASGNWLMEQVRMLGLAPAREDFSLNRVNPINASLTIGGRRIEGIPLFDGTFTDDRGIGGRLGALSGDARIGITEITPNAAGSGALGEARRQNRHAAIVAVTRGGKPGLCPSNADSFLHPFGPPVLQISSEQAGFLKEDSEAVLVADVKRAPTRSFNVTAEVAGSNRELAPLIVMTPRSGWWSCASERGGGIVCWLEVMRGIRESKPARDVLFVASSGHEIGYLGIEAFVANRPGIVKSARAWIHFGANIGAAQDPANTVQASDDEMEAMESAAMTSAGLRIDRRVPRGNIPGGEAGVVHRGGGRYMSLLGRSALFHNPLDRGPEAVDVNAIARFAAVFSGIAKSLAGTS